jgi:hypothetical protein
MWTSATDLVRWAIAVATARDAKSPSFLSQRTAAAMLTRQKDLYGLGPELHGDGPTFEFRHGGNNPGYTTQVTYLPETQQGVAILVNKVGADLFIDEIMRAVALEYRWPSHQPRRVTPAPLTASELASIAGAYSLQLNGALDATVSIDHGRVYLNAAPLISGEELVPLSADRFVGATWGFSLQFQRSARGDVESFTLTYNDNVLNASRVTPRSAPR